MVAAAIGLLWGGYFVGLYGYCLFRGYDVTPKQLLSSKWPPYSVNTTADVTSNGSGGGVTSGSGGGVTSNTGAGSAVGGVTPLGNGKGGGKK